MAVRTSSFTGGAIAVALAAFLVFVSPAEAQKTAAVCKDGTTSAAAGRGACSGHGGVNKAASKAVAKAAKSEAKAAKAVTKRTAGTQVTSVCADGSTSNASGRGACSGHGGVKGAEVTSKTTGRAIPAPATAVPPKAATPAAASGKRWPWSKKKSASTAATSGSGSAEDNNPSGAVAQCKDGMYSHAVNHQGACGHHGGVARWM